MYLIPGIRPTLLVGGRVFTDLTNLKILGTRADGGQYGTFRSGNATSGYQVGASTALTIYATKIKPRDGGQTSHGALFYADNDVGMNSVTAPTNAVYQFGDASFIFLKGHLGTAGGNSQDVDASHGDNFSFTVPSNKYLQLVMTGSSSLCLAYGYEV